MKPLTIERLETMIRAERVYRIFVHQRARGFLVRTAHADFDTDTTLSSIYRTERLFLSLDAVAATLRRLGWEQEIVIAANISEALVDR